MRKLCFAAVAACAMFNLVIAARVIVTRPSLNTDFLGLWSFAKFAKSQPVLGIYAAATLAAFQQKIFPGFHSEYAFPYPPDFLMAISWLGNFPFATAYALWTITGLAAASLAACSLFAGPYRWGAAIVMLASPASLLNGIGGETGFFTASLLFFGLAALPRRPNLAGIAFGLLSLKPQLAVLIPVALLARRDWAALRSAAFTAVAIAVLSCVVYPPALWRDWLQGLASFQNSQLTTPIHLTQLMVTVTSAVLDLDGGRRFAAIAQIIATLLTVVLTFLCFRNAPYRIAAAALLVGSLLATPHAYVYDAVPLAAAILLLAEYRLSVPFMIIAAAIYLAPLLLLSPLSQWFVYALPEVALFAFALRMGWREGRQASLAETRGRLQNTC
jgi:hypothetical protein